MKKRKKLKIYSFDPVIYPMILNIIVDDRLDQIEKEYVEYDTFEKSKLVIENVYSAFTMKCCRVSDNSYCTTIVFNDIVSMTNKTIAHEAVHASKFILEHVGMSAELHEPQEYIVGWIVDCCDSVKKELKRKKRVKVKN